MEPVLFPESIASVRDVLNFYRTEKIKNKQFAERINRIQKSNYNYLDKHILCKSLISELQTRENILSPLGNQICRAILQIPDTVDQIAVELRYLDQLTLSQIAKELHCSISTVSFRLRKGISQMTLIGYNKYNK